MDTWDSLMAAVRADPDEDTLRLAVADWLEENDQADRAEFIRLGVQLPGMPTCQSPRYSCVDMGVDRSDLACPACYARAQVEQKINALGNAWWRVWYEAHLPHAPYSRDNATYFNGRLQYPITGYANNIRARWGVVRGFPESVRGPWLFISRYLSALLEAFPITSVEVTTTIPYRSWSAKGATVYLVDGLDTFADRQGLPYHVVLGRILNRKWPRIATKNWNFSRFDERR